MTTRNNKPTIETVRVSFDINIRALGDKLSTKDGHEFLSAFLSAFLTRWEQLRLEDEHRQAKTKTRRPRATKKGPRE